MSEQTQDLNGTAIRFSQGSISDSLMLYVRTRMAEPHRHYHTIVHAFDLQNKFTQLNIAKHAHYPDDIKWCIWLHDLFYFPQNKNNEWRSAKFAAAVIDDADCAARVSTMICQTSDHTPATHDEIIFNDLDLSILAADKDRYDLYCEQIRSEYTFVSEALYKAGRIKVLEGFLKRETIFCSGIPGTELWDKLARDNIAREIERLRG